MTATPTGPQPTDGAATTKDHADAGREELARLHAEVLVLRAQLDTRSRRRSVLVSFRRVTAAVLVALSAFALVASVVGLWAAATTLNTGRWVATVTPLPQNPAVATAVAQYTTSQIFEVVDVDQRLRTVLPEQAAFIAGPLTAQVHDKVEDTVAQVLQTDRFQEIWIEANRRAHQQALAIINGTSTVVAAQDNHVDIDLLPMINQVLRVLSAQLPTLFGKTLTLPDLTSGDVPANLRARVQDALGVTLPANFARFTVYDNGRLRTVQRAVTTFKRDLAGLVGGAVALLGLALLISPRRRRTLLQLGVWLVIAAVAVTASLRAARAQVLEQVPAGVYRDGVAAAITTVTATLRERGVQIIWIGAVLAMLAYLVGPGRVPVWLRRQVMLAARTAWRWARAGVRAVASNGPAWIARHLDAIRIAGVVVAAVLALILSSWTALLVTVLVLAAFELAVTIVGRAGAQRSSGTAGDDRDAGSFRPVQS